MRRSLAVAIVLLLAASAQGIHGQVERDFGVAAHEGLDGIYERFSGGYRGLDPDAMADLYTADALYLAPDAEVVRGRDAIRDRFAAMFERWRSQGTRVSIRFRILERRVSGAMAMDVGIYSLVRARGDEETGRSAGKFVVVALREGEGEWRFHVDGYSGLPRAEP